MRMTKCESGVAGLRLNPALWATSEAGLGRVGTFPSFGFRLWELIRI